MFAYNRRVSDLLVAAFIVVMGLSILCLVWLRRRPARRLTKTTSIQVIQSSPAPPERRWLRDSLTAREVQVARLVVQGKRNAEIAAELTISINTVETHLKRIYAKLDVHSRGELTLILRDLLDALA